jgi:hypothetical protein
MALPLASYYAVTLAVPLANGAAQSGAFVEHALAVLVVPPVAIILTCTVCTIAGARRFWKSLAMPYSCFFAASSASFNRAPFSMSVIA